MRTRRIAIVPVLLVLLLAAGCNKTGTTAWQKVLATSDLIATTNNTVAQSVINAQAANLLSKDQAKAVLTQEANIARAHKQLSAILYAGATTSKADVSQINALLAQIKTSTDAMISTGVLGVKNPQTQMTIQASVDAIISLSGTLVAELSAAGVQL